MNAEDRLAKGVREFIIETAGLGAGDLYYRDLYFGIERVGVEVRVKLKIEC